MNVWFFLLLVLVFSSCKSTNQPKTSAGIPERFKRPTKAQNFERVSIRPPSESFNLDKMALKVFKIDTLTIQINVIVPAERQRLEDENRKLKKKVATWKKIAAVILALATGHYVSTL